MSTLLCLALLCAPPSPHVAPSTVVPIVLEAQAANPHLRFVFVHDDNPLAKAMVDTTLNSVMSNTGNVINTIKLSPTVLAFDVRLLQSKVAIDIWERFRQDEPYFLRNGPVDVVDLHVDRFRISKEQKIMRGNEVVGLASPGDYDILGKKNGYVEIAKGYIIETSGTIVNVVVKPTTIKNRIFGPHLPIEAQAILHPIVRYDWFIRKAWSSDAIGLYYDFRNITSAPKGSGLSDYEWFLKEFAGVTEAELARFNVDPFKKIAILNSKVTGKPRAAMLFSGAGSKVSNNQGLIAVTQDGKDNDTTALSDPFRNLLRHSFNAMEVFCEMPNGMIAYALFSGDINGDGVFDASKGEGQLQRTAPPDVVSDHTIPAPHTTLLQAGISCIRCHSQLKENGWKDLPNDIATLLRSKSTDILDENADVLASRYSGNLEKPIRRAREDLSEAITRITGVVDDDKATAVARVHGGIGQLVNDYQYQLVTPELAAAEIGVESLDWDRLTGIEDNIIAILRAKLSINRQQFELVYIDLATRLYLGREATKESETK